MMPFDEIVSIGGRLGAQWIAAEQRQLAERDATKREKAALLLAATLNSAVAVFAYKAIADHNQTMATAFANSLGDFLASDPIRPRS